MTGLGVAGFKALCGLGVFNCQIMNAAIAARMLIEDTSLVYARNRSLSKRVGGFNAILSMAEPEEAD